MPEPYIVKTGPEDPLKILPSRYTTERRPYGVDLEDQLAAGETLSGATVEPVIGDTEVTDVRVDGSRILFWLEGGTDAQVLHYLSAQVDTSAGAHIEVRLQIHVLAGHEPEAPPVDPDAPEMDFSDADGSQFIPLLA